MKQKTTFITLVVLTLFYGFALYECTRAATLPSCNGPKPIDRGIPEPDTILFLTLGGCFIFLRRNRTN